ncbi:MAG: hypothetical protein WBV46_15975 [Terriglobales bacterium]
MTQAGYVEVTAALPEVTEVTWEVAGTRGPDVGSIAMDHPALLRQSVYGASV